MPKPIKHVEAGKAPSIAHPEVANEIIDRVNAFVNLKSDPEGLIEKVETAKDDATVIFNTETMLVVRDGVLTYLEVPAVVVGEIL